MSLPRARLDRDLPRRVEAIDDDAERLRPERPLERHLHDAALRERIEDALRFREPGELEEDGEPRGLRELLSAHVGAEEVERARGQRRVDDLVAPLGREL